MSRSRVPVVSVVLSAVLSFLALPSASALSHDTQPAPDAIGATWTGTMSVSRSFSTLSPGRRDLHTGSATFTELRSLATTANGNYTATVRGSGEDRRWDDCDGAERLGESIPWTVDRDYGTHPNFPEVIGLRTDGSGQTFFTAQSLAVETDGTSYGCDGSTLVTHLPLYGVLGFEAGRSQEATGALPDSDPDPGHLVGTRTWTLSDPPYPLVESDISGYSYTVSYDLRLEYRCGSGDRPRFHSAQYDGVLASRAMLYFSLDDVAYCQSADGGIEILSTGSPNGALTLPPSLAGALAFVGGEFTYDGASTPVAKTYANGAATATTTGKYRFCGQVSFGSAKKGLVKVIAKLPAPVRKVVKPLLDRGAKALIKRIKVTNLLTDKQKRELIEATLRKLVAIAPVSRQNERALNMLVDELISARDGKFEEFIQSLFWDGICIPNVWRPTITVTISAAGAVSSTGQGPDGVFSTRPHEG